MDQNEIKYFVEAALLAAGRPLAVDQLKGLFDGRSAPETKEIRAAIKQLNEDYEERGIEIHEVASGFRIQVKQAMTDRLKKLWEERPPRYSRALFETLALIAYRQPITRGEIEEVRGVAVSSNIVRTLMERDWVRVVGHRDVPGRPAMFGTTKAFLDYFSLKKLDDLPELHDLADWESLRVQLDLPEVEETVAASAGDSAVVVAEIPTADAPDGSSADAETDAVSGQAGDEDASAKASADPTDEADSVEHPEADVAVAEEPDEAVAAPGDAVAEAELSEEPVEDVEGADTIEEPSEADVAIADEPDEAVAVPGDAVAEAEISEEPVENAEGADTIEEPPEADVAVAGEPDEAVAVPGDAVAEAEISEEPVAADNADSDVAAETSVVEPADADDVIEAVDAAELDASGKLVVTELPKMPELDSEHKDDDEIRDGKDASAGGS